MGIQALVSQHGETLQYVLYFGLLALFGALEALAPGRGEAPGRRQRWPANFGLTAVNIVALGALPVSGIGAALWAEHQGWGLLAGWPAASPLAVLLVTLGARSLSSYAVHVAMHRVPLLWRVHRVHHSDPFLDVSTTVRFHPLEFLVQLGPTVAVIVALGLPAWALLLYELLDTVTNLFIHANVRLPGRLEAGLRLFLVTPDLHRIHHSTDQPETDSNYGVVVPWWDRLFGTYRAALARGVEGMVLGLAEYRDRRATALGALLVLPFRRA